MNTTALAPSRAQFKALNKIDTVAELFEHPDFKSRILQAAPKHLTPDRLLRTFATSVQKTPKLAKVNPLSLMGAFITLAALGLEPNTPLGHAYLIPFDVNKWNPDTRQREFVRTDANLLIGYQGYLDLIYRNDNVRDVQCDVVWDGDEFSYESGSNKHLRHVKKLRQLKAGEEPIAVYMHARLANGGEVFEVLAPADVHLARSRSQAWRTAMMELDRATSQGKKPGIAYTDAPWVRDAVAMWRKTALRAGQKWLPKSIELAAAAAVEDAQDRHAFDFSNVIDGAAMDSLTAASDAPMLETDVEDTPEPTPATAPAPSPAKRAKKEAPLPAPTEPATDYYLVSVDGEMVSHTNDPVVYVERLIEAKGKTENPLMIVSANDDMLDLALQNPDAKELWMDSVKTVSVEPKQTEQVQAPAPSPPPESDGAAEWVNEHIVKDILSAQTINALNETLNNSAITRRWAKIETTRPELFARLIKSRDARFAELEAKE